MFHQEPKSRSMQEKMAADPSLMMDMAKKMLGGLIPQVRLQ
jgi:hypothetical protein